MDNSPAIRQYLESMLYALSEPSGERVASAVKALSQGLARRELEFREARREVDGPSFDLGALNAFYRLVSSFAQRSQISIVVSELNAIDRGIQMLHTIAFCQRQSELANQGRLATQLSMDQGNFSRKVSRLRLLGLVKAERVGRSMSYELTNLGRDVLDSLRPGWPSLDPRTAQPINSVAAVVDAVRESIDDLDESLESSRRLLEKASKAMGCLPKVLEVGRAEDLYRMGGGIISGTTESVSKFLHYPANVGRRLNRNPVTK